MPSVTVKHWEQYVGHCFLERLYKIWLMTSHA